jgi:hypothetical protein
LGAPEFGELFKVQADFEDEFVRDAEHEGLYARLIGAMARREKAAPPRSRRRARMIEHGARQAGDVREGHRLAGRHRECQCCIALSR